MTNTYSIVHSLQQVNPLAWDALSQHVFTRHDFLYALEQENCATQATGWNINYLLLHQNNELVGAVPLYVKTHSRGEYVFDHHWAQAYAQHQLAYYPKLLVAVPFTPVSGPRLLANNSSHKQLLAQGLQQLAAQQNFSSLHVLFPDEQDRLALEQAGFMLRTNVQFHWHNESYSSMEDFLASMTRDKRKKMRQDSKKVHAAGVRFRHLQGDQITPADLDFFYQCYAHTYLSRGQLPYLNFAFFKRWYHDNPESWVLIVADQHESALASALCIRDKDSLYGRYWGSMHYLPGLHFETCYTQTIEFCIAQEIRSFEGGAQGEHKLARGLLPITTYSAHWIADAQFSAAIQHFLDQETPAVNEYAESLTLHSPFKKKTVEHN
ncbi:GNAT family N-acetyltransferase [Alcaligenes endophyticus]|uniref:GNAT family N-acetyltransferase n=1 Tax=Alcaligenes endophyticus TaxID=1929088 RepID=A0ABT8EN93_9BURK|nr:GNAT family N-acetyltransferase [Alcaligenes endophyticus]MCX5591351.1 GNAT family N-acetyltransferase [Alcaligenes endophyticus]MDN4122768.1 GNAT family N-acetyltransferase [Alcaligenes endophyticus]